MKNYFYLIFLFLISASLHAQTITRTTPSQVANTVCPVFYTYYEVSIPNGFSACKIAWSAVNGTVMSGGNTTVVGISWNDTPGAMAEVTVTFSNCGDGNPNSGTTKTLKELILSVKGQSWGDYGNALNVDYCTTREIVAIVPRMFVTGTGGVAQPPRQEVLYGWTLPAGWKEKGTGRTGYVVTNVQTMVAEPVGCAKPGILSVEGVLNQTCSSAAQSAKATININGVNPVVSIGPQPGYTGGSACDQTPVTFYATTNVALGCITNYEWSYPPSWTQPVKSGNSITLTPSGTAADAAAIKVTLKTSCGTDIVSGNYVPPFKAPEISTGTVCSGGTTVTLLNSGPLASVTWTTSSNMTVVSGQGTPRPVIKGNSPFMGSNGTISAVITSCPQVTVPSKNVFQGLPYLASRYSDGALVKFTYPPNAVDYNMVCNLISKTVNMTVTGGTGSWTRIAASPTNTSWNGGTNNLSFYFFQANQTATFRYTSGNACGSVIQDFSFKSKTCGSGGCPNFVVSPNPSDKNVRIAIPAPNIPAPCGTPTVVPFTESGDLFAVKEEPKTIQSVSLFDSNGQLRLSKQYKSGISTVDLDISDLKKGIYMLIITSGDQTETHRIVKE